MHFAEVLGDPIDVGGEVNVTKPSRAGGFRCNHTRDRRLCGVNPRGVGGPQGIDALLLDLARVFFPLPLDPGRLSRLVRARLLVRSHCALVDSDHNLVDDPGDHRDCGGNTESDPDLFGHDRDQNEYSNQTAANRAARVVLLRHLNRPLLPSRR